MARTWQQAGVSVVPILPNQTKRPAIQWADFQVTVPTLGQVEEWWGNGQSYGLALICGAVSNNLEMTEIEGRACFGESMSAIQTAMTDLGIESLWTLLTGAQGYSEMSPSGGIHLLYRITDHPVPGNTKIAQDYDPGLPNGRVVLAETRGEGGYVIVAPTSGLCHPSGESWAILQGTYGHLPAISWEQRGLLHQALRRALNKVEDPKPETPAALPVLASSSTGSSAAGLSPGDDFEQSVSWDEILVPHGWKPMGRIGNERLWVRPGKNPRDGHSASTGYSQDRDRLFVWSTSTVFPTEQSLTKFAAFTLLNHGGDYRAAALELKRQGFGRSVSPELNAYTPPSRVEGATKHPPNDTGNALYLAERVQGRFLYVAEEKDWIRWDGVCWVPDQREQLAHEFMVLVQEQQAQAQQAGDTSGYKWWVASGNSSKIEGAIRCLRRLPTFTVTVSELNKDKHLINLQNGVYDLKSHTLVPADPDLLMTRAASAKFNPDADCPQFESFMDKVLPDPGMRGYVQRALGYSLLGQADQRSLFLICGPSGTGKSTLMAAMELLFGDYAVSAPSGTLRARGSEGSGPSNDLHMLRGKRFVSTSETNEHTSYNEDLIKRLTGRDMIQSRELYQQYQSWAPRCTIWLATNHPPRFNSDDDAIWRRAKVVPFTTVLTGDGEVYDFAHNILATELDGIFNWLLAGLKAYQEGGLGEPEAVQEAAHEVRLQSDPVSRFLEDKVNDGVLVYDPNQKIRHNDLYQMYADWTRQVGERALGSRRFTNRLTYAHEELTGMKVGTTHLWQGLGRVNTIPNFWNDDR